MKRQWPMILLLACAAAFAVGAVQLFRLRFEVGDVYPEYSSLRSDPLGTMAFYESVDSLPGISARRDFSVSNRLPEDPNTVYLHLAAEAYQWDEMPRELFHELDGFLARGGRLVVAFFPRARPRFHFSADDADLTNSVASDEEEMESKPGKEKMTPPKPAKKKKPKPARDSDDWVDLKERWGLRLDVRELKSTDGAYEPVRVLNRAEGPLPPELEWHSGLVFTNLDPAWTTVYARGTNAVVIERRFGRGTVVMATDSYLFSNEAMRKDRQADFLAWLIGPGRNVVFDEAHLGVRESPGVATLMRRYRLEGVMAGLILLAGLFVWKNSTSLVPPQANERPPDHVAGRDAAAGFVNLLRRSIAPRELLATCYHEWRKTAAQSGKHSAARIQQAEAAFRAQNSAAANNPDRVRAYQNISRLLQTRRSSQSETPPPDT